MIYESGFFVVVSSYETILPCEMSYHLFTRMCECDRTVSLKMPRRPVQCQMCTQFVSWSNVQVKNRQWWSIRINLAGFFFSAKMKLCTKWGLLAVVWWSCERKIPFFITDENLVWTWVSPQGFSKPCLMWTSFVLRSPFVCLPTRSGLYTPTTVDIL